MVAAMKRISFLVVSCVWFLLAGSSFAAGLREQALQYRSLLARNVLPYWYDTAVDWTNGGYILADDLHGRLPATEKLIVTQARMVWGFSLAHLKGYGTVQRNYLKAAENGYRFLHDKMRDEQNGGYVWTTDLKGNVTDARKQIYGQSFVIYALVQYYAASGNVTALREAMELY